MAKIATRTLTIELSKLVRGDGESFDLPDQFVETIEQIANELITPGSGVIAEVMTDEVVE